MFNRDRIKRIRSALVQRYPLSQRQGRYELVICIRRQGEEIEEYVERFILAALSSGYTERQLSQELWEAIWQHPKEFCLLNPDEGVAMWHLVQSICPFENQNTVQWIACGLEWHSEVRMGEVRLLSVAPGFVHYTKLIERVVVQTVENERGICASVESQLAVERKRSTTLRQENVQQSGTVRHLQEALANLSWYMGQMLPY